MKSARVWTLALIAWVAALVVAAEVFGNANFAMGVAPVAVVAAILMLGSGAGARIPTFALVVCGVVLSAGIAVASGQFWGEGFRSLGVQLGVQLGVLAGTLILICGLARRMHGVERLFADAVLPSSDELPLDFNEGATRIYQEVRRARRYGRSLSLLSIAPDAGGISPDNERLMAEMQEAVLRQYAEKQLAALLSLETDGCQVLTRRDGHFVVLLPEASRSEAAKVIRRLRMIARTRLSLDIHVGISSFPDENVTFGSLLEAAEAEMAADEANRASGRDVQELMPEASARG